MQLRLKLHSFKVTIYNVTENMSVIAVHGQLRGCNGLLKENPVISLLSTN